MSDLKEPPPPPTSPPDPPAVLSYAPEPKVNWDARLSVAVGLLLGVPLIGLAAIQLGRRGRATAIETGVGGRRLANAGIALGWLNLVLTAALIASLPPALIKARHARQQVQCLSNLRQIGLGVSLYCAANGGFLPPSLEQVRPYVPPPGKGPSPVFLCPACAGDLYKSPVFLGPVVTSSYHYVAPAVRVQTLASPQDTVVAYEPVRDHDGRYANFLFADGHAAALPGPLATKVIAELKAGQNPPPSIR